jgi:hypothetical protein
MKTNMLWLLEGIMVTKLGLLFGGSSKDGISGNLLPAPDSSIQQIPGHLQWIPARRGSSWQIARNPWRDPFVIIPPHPLIIIKAKAINSHSNFIEIKSTITLHASWNALFNSLTTVNKFGNWNIAGFTCAMDFKANPELKMVQLNQAYNFPLMANSTREVTILHNPYNFGRILLYPTDKVGCLVGIGHLAFPIIVNHQAALCFIQVTVPPSRDITNCLTVDNVAAIHTPFARRQGLSNLEGLSSFFPAPFLCNAILAADLASPLALILAGRAAQEEHIRKHDGDKGFNEGIVNAHIKLFSFGASESTKNMWKRVVSPSPLMMENSQRGAPASTRSTSFQALSWHPPFPPPRQTPPTSSNPLPLASPTLPRRPSTRIKSIVSN